MGKGGFGVSSNGAPDKPPFRITLDQQRLADELAQALADKNVSVHAEDGGWTVSIDDTRTDQVVVRVLDAIRDTLAGRPSASAKVQLDGNEYVMRGQDNISTTAAQAPTADETAEAGSDAAKELPLQAADSAAA
jgi:hypothetical protein